MACIARDNVEAACSKLRKMYCFIHKKTTPAFAEDGIEKIHPNGASDRGGCRRKLLIHHVPPEVRQFFELYAAILASMACTPSGRGRLTCAPSFVTAAPVSYQSHAASSITALRMASEMTSASRSSPEKRRAQ